MGVGYLYVDPGVGEPRDIVIAKTTLPHTPMLIESDELKDQAWYPTDALPYDKMPSDYSLWLPGALDGHLITAFLRNIDTDFSGTEVFGFPTNPENGRTTTLAHVE